jgi:hypothetical protein
MTLVEGGEPVLEASDVFRRTVRAPHIATFDGAMRDSPLGHVRPVLFSRP